VALALVLPRFLGRVIVSYGGTLRRAVWHSLIVRTKDFCQETQSIYRYHALVSGEGETVRTPPTGTVKQPVKPIARNLVGGRHIAMNDRVLFASLAPADAGFAAIDVTFFFEHTVVDPRMHLSLDMLTRIIRRTWMYRLRWLMTALSVPHLFVRRFIRCLKGCRVRRGFVLTIVTSDLCTLTLDAPSSVVHGWSNDMHTLERNAEMLMAAASAASVDE
jgi:hypothetical protein